ncbi:MAG TPA: glycosyltransferase [Clostridia bacterium]|nr:glycosyltransferase [Clostridia bacterium]
MERDLRVSVIIPTLNASSEIDALLNAIAAQTLSPDEIIVIDSESDDETVSLAKSHPKTRVMEIKRTDFDHGGARDIAFRASIGDVVLFLTQDAVIQNITYIEHIVKATLQDGVACAYGRQVARLDAPLYERYIREFNYPASSFTRSADDIDRLGIKAFFFSDVCSAYRRNSYLAVDGFDHPLTTNEDMLIAAKFLQAGFRIAYCSEAVVLHSHSYTWKQEYARNFLIGKVLFQYRDRFFGVKAGKEGIRLVAYVLCQLLRRGALWNCIKFCYLCTAKLAGNRNGYRAGAS